MSALASTLFVSGNGSSWSVACDLDQALLTNPITKDFKLGYVTSLSYIDGRIIFSARVRNSQSLNLIITLQRDNPNIIDEAFLTRYDESIITLGSSNDNNYSFIASVGNASNWAIYPNMTFALQKFQNTWIGVGRGRGSIYASPSGTVQNGITDIILQTIYDTTANLIVVATKYSSLFVIRQEDLGYPTRYRHVNIDYTKQAFIFKYISGLNSYVGLFSSRYSSSLPLYMGNTVDSIKQVSTFAQTSSYEYISDLQYCNGILLATTYFINFFETNLRVYYATKTENWSFKRSTLPSNYLNSIGVIVFSNVFTIITTSNVLTSTTGETFVIAVNQTLSSDCTLSAPSQISTNANLKAFLSCPETGTKISRDGINWAPSSFPQQVFSVSYSNGKYLIGSQMGNIFVSYNDGNTWADLGCIDSSCSLVSSVTELSNRVLLATAPTGSILGTLHY